MFGLSGRPEFELIRTDYDEKLFEGQSFKFFVPDRNGQCYLATEFGFNIIEVRKNPFTRYFSNSEKKQLPIKNSARGIYADDDSITVNFEFSGLVRLGKNNPDGHRIVATSTYRYFDRQMAGYTGRPLLKTSNGGLWAGHLNYIKNWSATSAEKTSAIIPQEFISFGEAA